MQLPHLVQHYISGRVEGIPFAKLQEAAESLSTHYRSARPTSTLPIIPRHKAAAYLAVRMPGTYAAAMNVLAEAAQRLPPIETVLDLGAGTGAASLASQSVFGSHVRLSLLDDDSALFSEAKNLLPEATFIHTDLSTKMDLPTADLVIFCYCLGELSEETQSIVLQRAWDASLKGMVIIEPGTSSGFSRILSVRDDVLKLGGYLAAPCPHPLPCPIQSPDWCHFAQRVERSAIHRRLKQGTMGYEDEKFCYLVFSKTPVEPASGRVVRRPVHKPGLIEIQLCQDQKISPARVTRKDKSKFRFARKAIWGSAWPSDVQTVVKVQLKESQNE